MSQNVLYLATESRDEPQEFSIRRHLYANSKAFLSRFLALCRSPRGFAPLIIDCFLFMQPPWSGRQLGPDLVYPMLGIRKRQSGRLARLILEHCKDQQSYELRADKWFLPDIDCFCVAVIDLDQVSPHVIQTDYRTQADLHGFTCMMILIETIVAFAVQFRLWKLGHDSWGNLVLGILVNLGFFGIAMLNGDGTLKLIRRSVTSISGCAVLLDQDFTVILNGKQSVVEAISESTFRRSLESRSGLIIRDRYQDAIHSMLEALCEGSCLSVPMLCFSVFRPLTPEVQETSIFVFFLTSVLLLRPRLLLPDLKSTDGMLFLNKETIGFFTRMITVVLIGIWSFCIPESAVVSHICVLLFYLFLDVFLLGGFKARDYPIRTAKLLDTLGHPRVKKWEFDTLAAAATFQCLVLCHDIPRPVRTVDVLAFLDLLIPDETEVWKAWKKRVGDRIMHEKDISFTPTIPTFRDEHQQNSLVDLLDQAQFGHDRYRELYPPSWGAPLDLGTADDEPPRLYALVWSVIRRCFFPSV